MFFYKSFVFLLESFAVALSLSDFVYGSWHFQYWNVLFALGAVFLVLKKTKYRLKFSLKFFLIFFLILVFRQGVVWGIRTFPLENPQLVILTLQLPVGGFASVFIKDFIVKVLICCVLNSFFISLLIYPLLELSKKRKIIVVSSICFCAVFNVISVYDAAPVSVYRSLLADDELTLRESKFFQKNYVYVDSGSIQLNSNKPKNLILILMESIENSFVDSSRGGVQQKNLITELLPADSNEYHFSPQNLIGGGMNSKGALNTISATIAKTTGCPLVLRKNFGDTLFEKVPSVYDLLQKFGYHNVFIQGTDATFSGTKNFVLSHGINTLYDMRTLESYQDLNQKYRNYRTFEAGITDRTLLEISKHVLDTLSKKDHFSLSIATIETHFPYGFYNDKCEDKPKDLSHAASLSATIRCASKDVRKFIEWIKKQPYYSNTEIVVVGDHLFMGDYLVNKLDKSRRWYDLFINPVVPPKNLRREFTSFDIAPTILESLGFEVKNHKMGLGVSLFARDSTIVEKIGIDLFDKELDDMQKSVEYNELSYPVLRK